MRNSDDNAPQDQNLIGASVTDLTAEDINTSENSPYTATATAVDRVDSQDESRADKDGSDVLDTPDISFLLKDYDNHFDGLGDLSFSQDGSDLRVVDGDGNEYIIAGYFDEAPPPSLRISESTELPFDFVQTLLAGTDLPAASGETPRATMVDAHDYAEYGSSIGNVETIVGEVKIIRTDGQTQILEAGDPVFEGDQILTETGASVKLVFLDNTLFSLGEDAQMTLDKMLYNAEEESGEVVLSMLKGMFLFVSGKIAKTDPTDMVVNTPVATIGIRGTIVTGRIDPDAQQTFEITVIDGAIATIPSGSDEPIVMSESFSTIIGENNAAGNLEISQSQETPQAVVARNVQQFSVLSSEDLQGIELAVESSAAESGEDVDLDLESALDIAIENETLGDVDAEQEDAVVDTPIPDAPAASNGAEEVEFESDVLLEDERPLEETLELEEEEESKGLEPAPELDITPPDPPLFVLAVNENNYLESGNSIIEGETEAGALVSVTLAGSLTNPDGTVSQSEAVFETLADDAGNWAIDFENDDPVSGNYNFAEESEVQLSVTAADASGNVSDAETGSFNFDLTAPEAPVIAPDSSVSYTASDNTTYIDGKTLSGTAEAGTTVHVTVDSETVDVTADQNGNWTLDLGANGIKPDHGDNITVSAQSEDKAGNLGETATQTYVVDSQTTAPQIAFNDLKNEATDNSPALSGTAEPGATVEVIVDDGKNSETFSVDADSNGNWTLDLGQESDGTLSLTHDVTLTAKATATDLVGNTSGTSSTSVKVDNSTTLSDVKFDKVVDGAVDGDPLLSGTAEPGSEVVVTVTDGNNNQTTFTPTVDASGNWSVMIVSKDDFEIKDGGSFSVKVDSKDELGNTDSVDLGSYTVDDSTTLTNVAFENTLTDTAEESFVGAEPVLKGIAEPGAKVTVIAKDKDGNEATFEPEVNESTGAWSVTVKGDPDGTGFAVTDDGELSVTVDSKDELGNEATQVSLGPYTVDASVSVSDVAFVDAIYPDDDSPGTVGDDPVLSGKAEVGATVTVTVTNEHKETATFTHTVDSSGEWSVQIVDQGEFEVNHNGTLVVGVDVADDLGNTEEVALDLYKVDAFVDAPTIEFDVASDGFSDKTPQLSGSAEAGATVHVTISDDDNNSVILNTTADGSGNWSLDIDEHNAGGVSLENGSELTATATATDIHKNESETSVQAEATVDAFVDAPTIEFDVASDGFSDKTPQLSGSAEAGATVHVTISDDDNNSVILNTTADGSGNWSLDIDEHNAGGVSLENGSELTATATATDIHKNESETSVQAEATVDAFVDAPTIEFDVASDGFSDKTPQLSGSAEAGATVHVTISDDDNNSVILNTTADGSGNWSLDIDEHNAGGVSLENGSELTATATATDIHKNESETSVQAEATVDAFVDAPTIEFDVASDGSSDKTPQLSGSAEAGATVHVTISDDDNNSVILNTTADGSGNWSLDIDENNAGNVSLENGSELTATATATDIHKNESETSVQAEATVDVEAVVGTFAFEGASGNTVGEEPVLSGQAAEPNAKVIVIIEDTGVGTATYGDKATFSTTADADGNWSITVKSGGDSGTDALVITHDTTFSTSVTVIDKHNNSETEKSADTYTVDASTELTSVGFDNASNNTVGKEPVLSGVAEAGAEVTVVLTDGTNSATYTPTVGDDGSWSVDIATDTASAGSVTLTDNGTLSATVDSTDELGNEATTVNLGPYGVDISTDLSNVSFDNVLNDTTVGSDPVLSGTAEAGSTVTVVLTDGTNSATYTPTVGDDGSWSVDIANDTASAGSVTLTDNGTLSATVDSTDELGNEATTVNLGPYGVDISTDLSNVSFDNVLNDTTVGSDPVLSGTAEAGSTVTVVLTDGTNSATYTPTVADDGSWSVDIATDTASAGSVTLTDNGTLSATVDSTDELGNEATTVNLGPYGVDISTDLSNVSFDNVLNDTTVGSDPVLSGTAEAGSTVTVVLTDGTNSATYTPTVGDDGSWSVDIATDTASAGSVTLTDNGTLSATVDSTDELGNEATTVNLGPYGVDISTDLSNVSFDNVLNDTTVGSDPVLSGTAEAGSTVTVVLTDGTNSATYTPTVADDGSWSVDIATDTASAGSVTLTDNGTLSATVDSTDELGNEATTVNLGPYGVDISTDLSNVSFDNVLNDTTVGSDPVLSGTAEAGSTVTVVLTDGTNSATYTPTVGDDGSWSVDIANDTASAGSVTLTDNGTLSATVDSTDELGNEATTVNLGPYGVDISTDLSNVSFDNVLNDTTVGSDPVLSGTAEAGSTVTVVLTDGTNSATYTPTVADDGSWSVDIANDTASAGSVTLTDNGTLSATVDSTDELGNEATTVNLGPYGVDISTDLSNVSFDNVLNDTTVGSDPVLSGTAEAGSTVTVVLTDGTNSATYTPTVADDGSWSVDIANDTASAGSVTLTDNGTLSATVDSTDELGNEATTVNLGPYGVDISTELTSVAFDNVLNDTTVGSDPVLSGTAEAGSTVTVVLTDGTNSATYTPTVADDGSWSVDIATDTASAGSVTLTDNGTLSATVDSTDELGNEATTVNLGPYGVDISTDLSNVSFDNVLNDTTVGSDPVLSGTAEAGSTVTVVLTDGTNSATYTPTVADDGSWSVDIANDTASAGSVTLTDNGTLSATVDSTDELGNEATTVNLGPYGVDISTDLSNVSFDNVLNDTTVGSDPVLSGTAEAGSTVTVVLTDGTNSATYTPTVADDGSWSVDIATDTASAGSVTLTDNGTLSATVDSTDELGNEATTVNLGPYGVDISTDLSNVSFDNVLNDTTVGSDPVLSGTAEAGSTVTVVLTDGTNSATYTPTVADDGSWSVDIANDTASAGSVTLTDNGTLSATVDSTDELGNEATTVNLGPYGVDISTDLSNVSFDNVLNDTTVGSDPVLSGTAEAGSTVTVVLTDGTNSATYTPTVGDDGSWSVDIATDTASAGSVTLTDNGTLSATVDSTDELGNEATTVNLGPYGVDISTDLSNVSFDNVLNDTTVGSDPVLSGTAEAGSTVTVVLTDGTNSATYTPTVADDGSWSVDIATDTASAGSVTLTDNGTLSATVDSTDELGNEATTVNLGPYGVDISTDLSNVSFDNVLNDTTVGSDPVLSGTAEAGSTVTVVLTDGTNSATYTPTVADDGSWSVDIATDTASAGSVTLTDNGTLSATVDSTDELGNEATTVNLGPYGVDISTELTSVAFDNVLNDTTVGSDPVLSGTAEAGSTVTVVLTDGTNSATYTPTVADDGSWSVDIATDTASAGSVTLTDNGTLSATVDSTDELGNEATTVNLGPYGVDISTDLSNVSFDNVLNDTTVGSDPVLSGTAEAGSTVTVVLTDGTNSATYTPTVADDGSWSVDIATDTASAGSVTLTDNGTLSATVDSTDELGNEATTVNLGPYGVDISTDLSNVSFDNVLNDTTVGSDPVLSGTAEAGSTVTVVLTDGTNSATYTPTVADDGSWSVDIATDTASAGSVTLTDNGTLSATVDSTDELGNEATTVNLGPYGVDISTDLSNVSFDNVLNDTTVGSDPVLSGTAEAGSTVTVVLTDGTNSATYTPTVADDGSWSVDIANDTASAGSVTLTDNGTLSATVDSTDELGNEATTVNLGPYGVDISTDLSNVSFDNVLNDTTVGSDPVLSGTAEAGSTVTVVLTDGTNSATYTPTVGDDGSWSVDIATDTASAGSVTLTDNGTLSATVDSTDELGNEATTVNLGPYGVDISTDLSNVSFDNVLNDTTVGSDPVLSGTAEAGSTVTVVLTDGTNSATYTPTVADDGSWSVDIATDTASAGSVTLTDNGTLSATVDSTDELGNEATTVNLGPYGVDISTDLSNVSFDNVLNDTTVGSDPVLSGTAEAGSTVTVVLTDGTNSATYTPTVADDGSWSVDIATDTASAGSVTLTDNGTLSATVDSTDELGNEATTVNLGPYGVDISTDLSNVSFDNVLNDTTVGSDPVLSGTAEAGSTVTVVLTDGTNSATYTPTVADDGSWSVDIATDTASAGSVTLTDNGTLSATVDSTDELGNEATTVNLGPYGVDISTELTSVAFDNVLNDTTVGSDPVLSGTAEAGSTVTVVLTDGTNSATYTPTVGDDGSWSVDIATDTASAGSVTLTDNGTLSATVDSTDELGNEATTVNLGPYGVDISTDLSNVSFDNVLNDTTVGSDPVLSGTAEAGSTVTVVLTDGTNSATYTPTVADDGSWSVDIATDTASAGSVTLTDNGTLSATVDSTDELGNEATTVNLGPYGVDISTDLSNVSFDNVLNDTTVGSDPVLSGTAEAGSTVTVVLTDGTNSATYTPTVGDDGSWSVDIANDTASAGSVTLTDNGTLSATVDSTDELGNEATTVNLGPYGVDISTDLSNVSFDNVLNDTTVGSDPVLSGTAEAGSTVTVVLTDGTNSATYTPTVADDGSWSVDIATDTASAGSVTLTDNGTLSATVDSTDELGNEATTVNLGPYGVDISTDLSNVSFDNVLNDTTVGSDPVLSGTAEAGSTVTVVLTDGTNSATYTPTVADDGSWSVDIATDTASAGSVTLTDNGTLSATVDSTDELGNEATTVNLGPYGVDISTDLSNVSFDNVLNDTTVGSDPVLSGTAEAGSTVTVVLTDGTNSATYTPTVADDGSWSVDIATDTASAGSVTLTDNGTLSATVDSTDELGNEATTVNLGPYGVDISTELTSVAFENTLTNTAGDFVGGKPVLSGVAEVGATVTVVVTDTTDSTKTATYTHVVTDSGGNWSIDIVDQGSFTVTNGGSFSVKVDSEDKLGNDATTVNLGPYTVDAVATDPEVFVLDQTPENIAKLVAGDESLFSGTADPNAAIKVEVTFPSGSTPASLTLDAQANGSGDWAISFNDLGSNKTAFTHGAAITLAVTATDPILNVSNTVTETYTVDYTTNETVDDTTFAGTTGDEVNFETQKADYLGPVSLTDSITSATTSKDEITTLTSFDDTVFVEDRGATYTNLGDGDDTIKFLKDEIAGVTGGTVFVDGGDGDDTADFSELTSSLYVNLSATAGTDVVNHTMSDGSILYRSFENVENISASSGWDTVEINRLKDLPNIDAGDGIDRLVLSQGGSTNIIDLTGGNSTIDGETVTMSGFEVFETSTGVDSVNTVVVDRDTVYVNGGNSAVSSSADYDTLQVSESGTVNFAAVDTNSYTYAGLHDYMTYATFFEKIEVSSDALMVLQTDEWQLKGATNSTSTSGVSNINISADASSGLMIDVESLWLNSSHWSYNDGTGETYLSTFKDSTSVQHNGYAYLRHGTEDLQIDLDADAVAAINNTYVHKNDGYGVSNSYNWSSLVWYNGINVEHAVQVEMNRHVVFAEAIGYKDNITLDEVGITIQSLTGAANLTLDEDLTITGDMYDYIGAVTINDGHKLDVGGTLDMSTSSEMIMSYSVNANDAVVSADHIDFAGSVQLHVDFTGLDGTNADSLTGIVDEWDAFNASSTSGTIDELIFKNSDGSELDGSNMTTDNVVLVGMADGGVQVVAYDSSKHTLGDGGDNTITTTNAEVYYGFAGDDSITISDYDSDNDGVNDSVHLQYLDGGEGHDTLALDGNADSFQSLFTDELFRINRIETLDISDLEGTLTLDEAAVLGLSDLKGSAKDGTTGAYSEWTELTIEGDGNTTLDLNGFAVDTSTSLARSGYTVYKSADSVVYVDDEIGTVK